MIHEGNMYELQSDEGMPYQWVIFVVGWLGDKG